MAFCTAAQADSDTFLCTQLQLPQAASLISPCAEKSELPPFTPASVYVGHLCSRGLSGLETPHVPVVSSQVDGKLLEIKGYNCALCLFTSHLSPNPQ